MDLSSILNKPGVDKAAISVQPSSNASPGGTARPPVRSSSLAQASSQQQSYQQVPYHSQVQSPPSQPYQQEYINQNPQLMRQHSIPVYHNTHQESHAAYSHMSPYAPHREDYFRDESQSVSPRTQPHYLTRHSSIDSYRNSEKPGLVEHRIAEVVTNASLPRSNVRESSTQSIISNPSPNYQSSRDIHILSPHLLQNPSVTSSPIQVRPGDYQPPHLAQLPADPRSVQSFRMPTHSPHQVKQSTSPILLKVMPPPVTPSQSHQASPMIQQREMSSASDRSSPAGIKVKSRSASFANIIEAPAGSMTESMRKRSLESAEQTARPPKRIRYQQCPVWAQRIEWKANSKLQTQWVPEPRAATGRLASVAHPSFNRSDPNIMREDSSGTDILKSQATNGSNHPPAAQPLAPAPVTRDFEAPAVGSYEPSIDGNVPFSEVTREVGLFIFQNLVKAPELEIGDFEIEAKLGTIIDPGTQERIHLPITTEAVLAEGHHFSFRSNMTPSQHKLMNRYLNTETERTSRPESNRQKIKYEHLRETDKQYKMPTAFFESLPELVLNVQEQHRRPPRVRVTTDQKTGKIKAVIYKLKVKDLEIYCPQDSFDIRISIALEIRYPSPVEDLVEVIEKNGTSDSRFKDRLSYKHQFVSVDLTQVTDGSGKKQELELECDTRLLRDEGQRMDAGLPNNYEGIVGIFTNYIRVMNRTCRP